MTVVVFAMLFVVLALGTVVVLMHRAHKHAVRHSSLEVATEMQGGNLEI
jgi:hypothetical protein